MAGVSHVLATVSYWPLVRKYRNSPLDVRRFINRDVSKFLRTEIDGDALLSSDILIKCLRSEYFRVVFYHRTGKNIGLLKNYKRQSSGLIISPNCLIWGGIHFHHPYNTIINAKSIGENFTFRHLTTIGNKVDGRNDLIPTIGNNVTLGANVIIIGDISVGDNVVIGAGAVVTKDVPSNSVVAGNPAKVLSVKSQ